MFVNEKALDANKLEKFKLKVIHNAESDDEFLNF